MADKKETTESALEPEEIEAQEVQGEVSETSTDEQESSKSDTEAEEEKAESGEEEKPEKDGSKSDKEEEESIEERIDRLSDEKAEIKAKSMSDKSLKTYQQKAQADAKKIQELETELSNRQWQIATDSLFEEESELKDEEVAKRNKEAREAVRKQVQDFRAGRAVLERAKSLLGGMDIAEFLKENALSDDYVAKDLPEYVSFLNNVARDQMAERDVRLIFYGKEDKAKEDKIKEAVKKFAEVNDDKSYKIVLESIRLSHEHGTAKAGKTKYKPDGTKPEGTGIDWKNMTAEEKIERGLAEEAKKTGG